MGKYAMDENDAHENVAVSLSQRLQEVTSRKVVDFNYHNVIWMEDYIRKLEFEINELIMVNATLVEEMKIMQKKI
ncbi:hypothetical protein SESBI_22923 [Sesbania bispinosa]|nr:hypothetical protein SESBI_22923 [Sesbania bispinosa]